jgi:hypothetical protein
MALPLTGTVGPQILADGASPSDGVRMGKYGDIMVTELTPRYAENTKRGYTFLASNQAAQAVSVALATTYTGICLSNPIGNTKNLVLLSAGFGLTVAPAAIASIHLIGGYSATTNVTHTAAITPDSGYLGSVSFAPTAKVDSQATIPTPKYLFTLQGGFTAATLPASPLGNWDCSGQLVIPPGGFVCIGALTAVTGFGSFSWMEEAI